VLPPKLSRFNRLVAASAAPCGTLFRDPIRLMCPAYVAVLIGPGDRKIIQPMTFAIMA
jgi:hypothetical protein